MASIVSNGDVNHLYETYNTALSQRRRVGILNSKEFVSKSRTATEKVRALFAYIEIVTELNLSLIAVENGVLHRNVLNKRTVSVKYLKEMIFSLTRLVEES